MATTTITTGTPPTRHLHHLCEVGGHLALNTGWRVLDDAPYIEHHFIVAQHIPMDDMLRDFIDQKVYFGGGDGSYRGLVRGRGRFQDSTVDMSKGVDVVIREEIKKPRDGKEYTWRWGGSYNQWVKEGFPKCAECSRYHDPAFIYCEVEDCWRCHKPGKCPPKRY